jgi:hypothetical protein
MSLRIAILMAVLAGALMLVAGAGAGSQPPMLDIRNQAAVDSYLRSIGIDPASVVRQVGLRNYAGPNCPGVGWNCTTSTMVVQIANDNGNPGEGENEFECKPKRDVIPPTNPATNTCVILQAGKNNHASCEEQDSTEPTSTELCDITQSGRTNSSSIQQDITQTGGPIQRGNQTAKVNQEATDSNSSQILQRVGQGTSVGVTQMQDGFQQALVTQHATGSRNFSNARQIQAQSESGSAGTQNQNTTADSSFNCGAEKPTTPNQCVNLLQDATPGGGRNTSQLFQAIGERATSNAFAAPTQTQGTSTGGQEGNVHQENPPGLGQNLNFADQVLAQRESSPTGTFFKTQHTDPGCCGVGTQVGGATTTEDIDQATIQSSTGSPNQDSSLFGETHQVNPSTSTLAAAAPTTSSNNCEIEQFGSNNSVAQNFSTSGNTQPQCMNLVLATHCFTFSGEGGDCVPAPPPCPCPGVRTAVPGIPTGGLDIAMPNYYAVPADWTP